MAERRALPAPPAPEPDLSSIEFRELLDLYRFGPRWKTICHPHAMPRLIELDYVGSLSIPMPPPYSGVAPCWYVSEAGKASLRARGISGQWRG